ncbi:hypothetical protein QYF36_009973 [Acer negundo]|nr:hypothetical protein QYF36_009973 [Acer negundo]
MALSIRLEVLIGVLFLPGLKLSWRASEILMSYVETLLRKSSSEFIVVISQMNGQYYSSNSVHAFNVGKMRIKLCRGWITKSREIYHPSMNLCGVRGDGNAAAWKARKGLSFVLTFESKKRKECGPSDCPETCS